MGDLIIAGNDLPGDRIVQFQTYELQRVYFQGLVEERVERVDVETLEATAPNGCEGFDKFIVIYSPQYHSESGPVCIRPDEIEVVTLKTEVLESLWLSLPGLFWLYLCVRFWEYGVATGRL